MNKHSLLNLGYQLTDHVFVHADHYRSSVNELSREEQELLGILKEARDISTSSREFQHIKHSWFFEYHLSGLRHNLLRGLKLERIQHALELGAGCGAITRQLGERCQEVVALEGKFSQARIARERCRNLDNVSVVADQLIGFTPDCQFDLVTLIGSLATADAVVDSPNDPKTLMQLAKNFLTAEGTLLIAIENQLGLKYFNGCHEDHQGQVFFGINDLYHHLTTTTLGYEELKDCLLQLGFEHIEFLFPFPDHKLPNALIRQQALEESGLQAGHILGHFSARDYHSREQRLFSETLAWNLLGRNKLIPHLSNSFLVLASMQPSKLLQDEDWLIKLFSDQRQPPLCTESVFFKANDQIQVSKKQLHDAPSFQSKVVSHHLHIAKYVEGRPMHLMVSRYLLHYQFKQPMMSDFRQWLDFLRAHTLDKQAPEELDWLKSLDQPNQALLPGIFLDCTPRNLIHDGQRWNYIDQEWEWLEPLPLVWVVFRGLISLLQENEFLLRMSPQMIHLSKLKWVCSIMEEMGIRLGAADASNAVVKGLIGLEERFLNEVSNKPHAVESMLQDLTNTILPKTEQENGEHLESMLKSQLSAMYPQDILELQELLHTTQQELNAVKNSMTWRTKESLLRRVPAIKSLRYWLGGLAGSNR